MENKNANDSLCKSVFKNGEKINKSLYTQKWIEIINKLEKNSCPKGRDL